MKYLVTNPLNYFFLTLGITLLIIYSKRIKWFWSIPTAVTCLITFYFLTPAGANQMVDMVALDENSGSCSYKTGIVLLGSLSRDAVDEHDFGAFTESILKDTNAAVQWAQGSYDRKLIIMGGVSSQKKIGSALLVKNFITLNGVSHKNLELTDSSNSISNSISVISHKISDKKVTSFSSDIGARRLKDLFSIQNISACIINSSTNQLTAHRIRMLVPSADAIKNSELVLWEFFGILWAKWKS